MNEQPTSIEQLWNQLSGDVKEVCLALCADAFERDAVEFIAEDPENFFLELNQRGLLEEVSQLQLYQERSLNISEERIEQGTSLRGFDPPLSNKERSALLALDTLRKYDENPDSYPYMREVKLRFVPHFEMYLQKIVEQELSTD